jgi:hypothetical protein
METSKGDGVIVGGCDSADWNPIASAVSHSQLAGVVAGLVFAGIVVVLQRQARARRPAEALTMFLAGFFTFALDSFFFSVVAGERTCPRAWTETMLAAGLLGFGALSLFLGVAWLLFALDRASSTPFRVTRVIVYVLVLIVVSQLNATARDYLRDVRPPGHHQWIDALLTGGIFMGAGIIVLHIALARRLSAYSRRATGVAAYFAIAYVLVCALAFGLLTVVETSYWNTGAKPMVYITATLVSVTLPTIVVTTQLIALPWPEPRPSRVGADNSADAGGTAGDLPPAAESSNIATAEKDRAEPVRHGRSAAATGTARGSVIYGGLALIAVGIGAALAARHLRDTDVN